MRRLPLRRAFEAGDPQAHGHDGTFARMGRNIGWLLGGRGFGGAIGLVYLGIAARVLGPAPFGMFALMLAYGQAIANLAQFQSWQAVIRYGAIHLARARHRRLARLLGFTATLDAASAVGGALVAGTGVAIAGPLLGWPEVDQQRAALFGAVLLLSIGATPNGILRLFDRFDLLAFCQAIGPLVRLAGSIMIWLMGGSVDAFLAIWATAALLQSGATWCVASWIGGGFALGLRAFRRARRENEGIGQFMLVTNLSSSLSLLLEQLGTLAVGGVAGASAAGGFRLASHLSSALAKPVQVVARALYPEVARLVASDASAALASLLARVNRIALVLAVLVVLIAMLGGSFLLRLMAGDAYAFAYPFVVQLGTAAAIELSGFALDPLLTAHDRAGVVLATRGWALLAYGAMLLLLPSQGPAAAGLGAIAAALVVRVRLALAARCLLRA